MCTAFAECQMMDQKWCVAILVTNGFMLLKRKNWYCTVCSAHGAKT